MIPWDDILQVYRKKGLFNKEKELNEKRNLPSTRINEIDFLLLRHWNICGKYFLHIFRIFRCVQCEFSLWNVPDSTNVGTIHLHKHGWQSDNGKNFKLSIATHSPKDSCHSSLQSWYWISMFAFTFSFHSLLFASKFASIICGTLICPEVVNVTLIPELAWS